MKVLVTGATGFVGKNLCAQLNNIREGKDKCYDSLSIEMVYEYDLHSTFNELELYCQDCDFVFHLAGVNRPQKSEEFIHGNVDFTTRLLNTLQKYHNTCPVMLSSSIQATLAGRWGDSEYGRSKKAAEELMFDYGEATGAPVLIYRFPNLFGKWCRPNYNSAVATFCYNIAHDLQIQVNDRNVEMELLYIDDLVDEMMLALQNRAHRCNFEGINVLPNNDGAYCYCPITHKTTLGNIVDLIYTFANQPKTLTVPEIPANSLAKKLYSTYLSYLPKEKISFPLKMNIDQRGSFTELVHMLNCGQISVNISKPGITKGQHWHNTKWEFFIVVSGHGLIQERKIDSNEIIEFEVCGDKLECIQMLPGYTHNITNLSQTQDLITIMYCNETFDKERPDTYFLPVNN